MAYADKCFYFDWGNRKIKLEDYGMYDELTVRRRTLCDDNDETQLDLSIELWGANKADHKYVLERLEDNKEDERFLDTEIVLTRDNAMALACKILRAVAELDANEYMENLANRVEKLEDVNRKKLEELEERYYQLGIKDYDKKGGIGSALGNFLDTKQGEDAFNKINEKGGENGS